MSSNKANVRYIPIVRIQDTMKEKLPLVVSELASLPLVNTAGTSQVSSSSRTVRTTTRRTVSRSRSVSPSLRVTYTTTRSPSPQPQVKVTLEPVPQLPQPQVVIRTRSLSPLPPPAPLQHNGTRILVSPAISSVTRRRYITRTPSPIYLRPAPTVPAPVSQPAVRAPSIERFSVTFTSPVASPCRSPSPRPIARPSPVASPRILRRDFPNMSVPSNMICLRRLDTSTPWGFRLNGGAEYGQPLYIHKVTVRSIAHKAGLQAGDAILQIGDVATGGMTHLAAKGEILRAGNEVDFIIQRGAVQLTQLVSAPEPRSRVLTTSSRSWTAPAQNPGVQSRSFILLQKELGV